MLRWKLWHVFIAGLKTRLPLTNKNQYCSQYLISSNHKGWFRSTLPPDKSWYLFDCIRNRKSTGCLKGRTYFWSLWAPGSYNNETNWITTISILLWEGGFNSLVLTLCCFLSLDFPTSLSLIYSPLKNKDKDNLLAFRDHSGMIYAKALCSYTEKPDAHPSTESQFLLLPQFHTNNSC